MEWALFPRLCEKASLFRIPNSFCWWAKWTRADVRKPHVKEKNRKEGRAEAQSLSTAPRLGIATGETENRDDRDNANYDESNHGGPLFLLFQSTSRLLYGRQEANPGKHVCCMRAKP